MRFIELNAAAAGLRHSLRNYVGENALNEIYVRPPAGEDDEASFMRLVNWTYVLLFEAGRVAIPYLTKLPSGTAIPLSAIEEARIVVHDLRTWISHNVGFSSEREAAISRRVSQWFLNLCNTTAPENARAWRSCFNGLCREVGKIVKHCQSALELIVRDEDDLDAIDDLKRRVERSWSTDRLDALVRDICVRLSLRIDVPKFRNSRLSEWRKLLDTVPEEDDPERAVIRIIERDLLNHASDILPIDGRDVISALDLEPGPEIGSALQHARELLRSGIRDRAQLLERLKEWHAAL